MQSVKTKAELQQHKTKVGYHHCSLASNTNGLLYSLRIRIQNYLSKPMRSATTDIY